MDDPSRLVVLELFLPRAENERGERERERRTIRLYTHSDREREREGRTRDARNALRGGGKRRKEEKKERRTQRSAVRTDERTYERSFHLATDYSTSRFQTRTSESRTRESRPSVRASLVRIRSIRLVDRSRACHLYYSFFFCVCVFSSFPPSRDVRVHLSLSLFLSPVPVRSPLSSFLLTLFLSVSFSVAQRAEYNVRFTLHRPGETEVRVARVCRSTAARSSRSFPHVREKGNRRGAYIQRALPGHDGVPVGLS